MNLATRRGEQDNRQQRESVIIPETGDFAPERMFVAVRAIAPVAGSPPNSGDTILAMPGRSVDVGVVLGALSDRKRPPT